MDETSDRGQRRFDLHRTSIGLVTAYVTLFDAGPASAAQAREVLLAAAGDEFTVAELLVGVSGVAAGLADLVAQAKRAGGEPDTSVASVLQFIGGRAATLGE